MTLDEIGAAADQLIAHERNQFVELPQPGSVGAYAYLFARALLAALPVVGQARAHQDMTYAVAAFDRTMKGLEP